MVNFGLLLTYPDKYKHLLPTIKDVKINDVNIHRTINNIIINGIANNHNVKIIVNDIELRVGSPVMVTCDCDAFKYNFAYGMYKMKSLIDPEHFFLKPSKKKNPSMTISGCKHLIAVSNFIWSNRNNIMNN